MIAVMKKYLLISLFLTTSLHAQDTILIRAKKVYTVTGPVLENTEILIAKNKIKAIGAALQVPSNIRSIDTHSVVPGFVDAHTHVALDRSTRPPGPVTAEWRAVDHVNLQDPMLDLALQGGLTSLVTRPGSGIVSSGQGVALKLRSKSGFSRVFKEFVDLKMAVRPLINIRPEEKPATVMGWYAIADEYFRRAKEYLENDGTGDPRLEAFAAVLRGEVMVHAHSHYPSEIQMVFQLAERYGFINRLALAHVEEAFPIAEQLADKGAIAVVGPVMIVRYYGDEVTHNVVKELADAGVIASVQTDQSKEQLKDFREYGAFLVRHGMREEDALRALTINGAKAMMLEQHIGSIEIDKDADLVLFDGHPFDLTSDRIEFVIVDGKIEYEREKVRGTQITKVGPFKDMAAGFPNGPSFAFINAHLFTVTNGIMRNATIVIQDGKIAHIGINLPKNSKVPTVDIGNSVILPGFISARAYPNDWIGDLKWQVQNDEITDWLTPEMNARFAVDPWFPSFEVIREVGITTQNITPGHRNLAGGNGVIVKNIGMDLQKMVKKEPSSSVFSMAADRGEIRELFYQASQYLSKSNPSFNAGFEALRPLLRREIPAIFHALTVQEIRKAMRLANEFNLRLIISGAVQAHLIANELSKNNISVILGDTASNLEAIRGGGEGYDMYAPLKLQSAGVNVAFYGPSGSRRGMPTGRLGGEPALNAAWVFRNGVSEAEAIKMFTLNAAEMFDIGNQTGSLSVGKDADLVVYEGHPFDYQALPLATYIDGKLTYKKKH